MSASSSRKKRQEQSQIPASRTQKKKKKKLSQGAIFAITIIAIVAVLVSGVLIYRTVRNNRTVLTVGDYKISVKEFNYFYNNVANNISSYASYFGIASGVPLDEQYVTSNGKMYAEMFGFNTEALTGKEPVEDVYDVTWAQIIASTAKDNAISAYAVYSEAMAAGYQIDDHLQHEIDEQVAVLQGYADQNGESLNALIQRVYGSGCNEAGFRQYLAVVGIAQHYPSERSCSAEEIAARFEQEPEKFTVAAYYLYSVTASEFEEEEVTEPTDEEGNVIEPNEEEAAVTEGAEPEATEEEATEPEATEEEATEEEATEPEATEEEATEPEATEEGEGTEPTEEEDHDHEHDNEVSEEAKQKAEEAAKAMEENFDVDNEKVSIRTDNTRETVTSAVNEEAAAWLFDTAKDGDAKLFVNEETNTYYVVKLLDKSDYLTLNALQIYIDADAEDAELAEGELSAAEKVEKIKAALNADASEANFKALMEEYGEESEPIENLTRASAASVSNELLTWYMEEAETGKWIAVDYNGGTIFLYCLGRGDDYHTTTVRNTLNSEWRDNVIEAAKLAAVYDEAAAMTANVGLAFN